MVVPPLKFKYIRFWWNLDDICKFGREKQWDWSKFSRWPCKGAVGGDSPILPLLVMRWNFFKIFIVKKLWDLVVWNVRPFFLKVYILCWNKKKLHWNRLNTINNVICNRERKKVSPKKAISSHFGSSSTITVYLMNLVYFFFTLWENSL